MIFIINNYLTNVTRVWFILIIYVKLNHYIRYCLVFILKFLKKSGLDRKIDIEVTGIHALSFFLLFFCVFNKQ